MPRRRFVRWGALIFLVLANTFNLSASAGPRDVSDRNVEIIKSLHSCIEDTFKGKSGGRGFYDKLSKVTLSRREFLQMRQKQLRSLKSEELRTLLGDQRLDAIDNRLVEITMGFRKLPDTFVIIEYYGELSWGIGGPYYGGFHWPSGPRTRAARLPFPKERHLLPQYRAAWESMLLVEAPPSGPLPFTALRALGKIGDPRSLELMEVAFRWGAETRKGKGWGDRVIEALGMYKRELLPKALETAFRCWKHARELAGKRFLKRKDPHDSSKDDYWTVPADLPDALLQDVAQYFAPEFIASEAKKAKPDSEYGKFLESVVTIQQAKP